MFGWRQSLRLCRQTGLLLICISRCSRWRACFLIGYLMTVAFLNVIFKARPFLKLMFAECALRQSPYRVFCSVEY